MLESGFNQSLYIYIPMIFVKHKNTLFGTPGNLLRNYQAILYNAKK